MKANLSLLFLILLFPNFLLAQKTYLQRYIEGNKEKEEFNLKHKIKFIRATILKKKGKKFKEERIDYEEKYNEFGKTILYKEFWKKNKKRSRIHYFKYNSNQRLIEHEEKSDYLFIDYHEVDKIKYNIDFTQALIDRTWNSYNLFGKNNYTKKSNRNFLLNQNQQIIATINIKNDTTYFNYNEQGKFLNKSNIKNDTISHSIYDNNGNLIEFNYHKSEIDKYYYDKKGNCIKSELHTFKEDERKYILTTWRKLIYDINNRLIEVRVFKNKNELEYYFKLTYEGELEQTKKFYDKNNNSKKMIKYEYEFY